MVNIMAKKVKVTLSVDEDIVKEAKEEIPNLSKVLEETLKIRLASKNKDEYALRLEAAATEEEIVQLQNKLDTINATINNMTHAKEDKSQLLNTLWRAILISYREYRAYKSDTGKEFTGLLGITEDELVKLLDEVLLELKSGVSLNDMREWSFVEENYFKKV